MIGDFSDNRDEGLKNLAHSLADRLETDDRVAVHRINIKRDGLIRSVALIRQITPDIIHYVPGPTNMSLLLLKYLRLTAGGDSKVVLSSPHPRFSNGFYRLLRFKPDHVLCSSKPLQERVGRLGIPSTLVPNGIDLQKFRPTDGDGIARLRRKHGMESDKPIVLHVGHLTRNRNLSVLEEVSDRYRVVVVASHYLKRNRSVEKQLAGAGCTIVHGYQQNVEELYQASDCYVFPVDRRNTITAPLSVMEAMACNLRVVTTRCDGLTSFFREGEGLAYADSSVEVVSAMDRLLRREVKVATRDKVSEFSWDRVAREIIAVYESLLGSRFGVGRH